MKKVELSENALEVASNRYFMNGEDWEQCTKRVSSVVASADTIDKQKIQDSFQEMIYNMDFLPGGRILRNSGRPRGSLFNCYHLPIGDSIEEIGQFYKDALTLWSEGGGVGVNFSPLRPRNDVIHGKGGHSSGLVSFMEGADFISKLIESGGSRRAAAIGHIDVSHPEVMDFIDAKLLHGRLSHFNISVMVNHDFLERVETDQDWTFKFKQKAYGTVKAKDIWDKIVSNMVRCAEPGLINWSNFAKNNSYYFAPVTGTNPCGETTLSPNEACDLGSLVLPNFITGTVNTNWKKLESVIKLAIRFLDNIIDVNKSFIKLYGYSRKEMLGMKNTDFSAEPDKTAKATQSRELYVPIRSHKKKDGTVFPVEITASIFEHHGRDVSIAAIRDISHRERIEAQLKTSLKDKEILLREIHHRVKNNFEIISSLLDLGGMQKENIKGYHLLADTRSRIHSMALIHEQLYQSKRFDRINMFNYTREMVDYIAHIYANKENSINTIIDPSGVYLTVDQAIPCAIAINELIANAFKHGFILKKQGAIYISIVNLTDDTVLIRVKDDGDGISKKIDLKEATGLGFKLVRHLIEGQLGGEMDVRNDDGTDICLQFKKVRLSEKA